MAATAIRGAQIQDGTVQRADLDISTVGSAVVRKLVQGTGITLSSTGADSGTGDVTINAVGGGGTPGGSNTQLQYNNSGAFGGMAGATYVAGTGALTLKSDGTNQDLTLGPSGTGATNITSNAGAGFRNSVAFINTNGANKSSQFSYYSNATPLWSFGNDTGTSGMQDFYIYDNVNTGSRIYFGTSREVTMPAGSVLGWANSNNGVSFIPDTALFRNAGGVVEINNGTPGTYRDLKLRTLLLNPGAAPTGVEGALYGNSTDHKLWYHNGTTFVDLTLGGGGSGTVTSFSAGDLAPLFTTTEANPTTTPALSFALTNAAANSWFGNATGSAAAPAYNTSVLPAALMPAHTGEVTSPSGSTVNTIANGAVIYARMQNVSANSKLLGSGASGAGAPPVELSIGNGLAMTGTTLAAALEDYVAGSGTGLASSFATNTIVPGSTITIPTAGGWKINGVYHCVFDMGKTAAGTAAFSVNIHMGTLGTTGDAIVATITPASAGTAAIDFGLFDVYATFQSVGGGTSAKITVYVRLNKSQTATGLANTGTNVLLQGVVSAGFNSTTQTKISVGFNGGASFSGSTTFAQTEYEQ
jgi:Repeat of unknown function (DUF5907)